MRQYQYQDRTDCFAYRFNESSYPAPVMVLASTSRTECSIGIVCISTRCVGAKRSADVCANISSMLLNGIVRPTTRWNGSLSRSTIAIKAYFALKPATSNRNTYSYGRDVVLRCKSDDYRQAMQCRSSLDFFIALRLDVRRVH